MDGTVVPMCTRLLGLSGKSATFTSYPYEHCSGCKSIFHKANPLRKFTRRVEDYYLLPRLGIRSKFGNKISNLLYDHFIGKETCFSSFFLLFFLSIHSFSLLSF
jgi:hypothetical protein